MIRAIGLLGIVEARMVSESSSSSSSPPAEGAAGSSPISGSPYFTPVKSIPSPYWTPPRSTRQTRSSARQKETIDEVNRLSSSSSSSLEKAVDEGELTALRIAGAITPRSRRRSERQRTSQVTVLDSPTHNLAVRKPSRVKPRDVYPLTPGTSPDSSRRVSERSRSGKITTPKRQKRIPEVIIALPPTPKTPSPVRRASQRAKIIVAKAETGIIEPVDKILLIQERVRHDPWKLLVATTLLNVTSGRAARPVFIEILKRWPDPESLANADMQDLVDVLYPIGLFIQRANSLKIMSKQYLDLRWPILTGSSPSRPCNPYEDPIPSLPLPIPPYLPESLDVYVFRGAGRYASDSFRIYSHLLPGFGAPHHEAKWLSKRSRAIERMHKVQSRDHRAPDELGEEPSEEMQLLDVLAVGECLSEEEEEEGEEEWRAVRPTDKELRRYLIWRWGLEGIEYDIMKGPKITRARDKRRLKGFNVQ
ncbi:hypothetical protein BD324DRAFT_681456 [Kockovaella imperatae]|uniref:HhH-GPD domain-containing protein n=1 Tax=Kockovaella imperatae TaxID=4999 RepID=A0A1Y1UGQ1_9TREE|nr:hypothetical protein BD324DRAFT_681456 [Kockovaella imperatae]ORX36684.1 hypothetical protein BD324DRAFT_681456 [Kockovaella imperatae]